MARYTRELDPATGDRRWDAAAGTWAAAASPELTIVQNVLATEEGRALRDPSFGVVPLSNAGPNASAAWRQRVLTALRRWTADGTLRNVTVDTEVIDLEGGGAALTYTVSFDGRTRSGRQTTPRRTL